MYVHLGRNDGLQNEIEGTDPYVFIKGSKMTKIETILYSHQDEKYGDFISKLIPTLPREKFIGIRSPTYKKILKELKEVPEDEIQSFLATLPHTFHEENALHISLINRCNDFDQCIQMVEAFMPYVDNWAISDALSPKGFEKNHQKLMPYIQQWMSSTAPYTLRIAMLLIMKNFLDEDFDIEYLEMAAKIRSGEYYVNMMTAWLFAEALVKQWNSAIPFIQNHRLDKWTNNKAIQKARESYRITSEQKEYLKTLRIK